MSLTLRPTDLPSPVDRHHLDYMVFSGEWAVGRIYEDRGALPPLRWFWALLGPRAGPRVMRKDGRAAILEDAKAELNRNWHRWLTWAELRPVQ